MTKPQLHRHLTTGIFNQLSKILKKLRLSDFFLDRAAELPQQVLELCAPEAASQLLSVFCATKPDYQPLCVCVKLSSDFLAPNAQPVTQPQLTKQSQPPLAICGCWDHLCDLNGWWRRPEFLGWSAMAWTTLLPSPKIETTHLFAGSQLCAC
jgi:hypothetical protein